MAISAAMLLGSWALGALTWQLGVVMSLVAVTNEIHNWAHRPKRMNGPMITFLQRNGILQSSRHHARHHRGATDTHYCILTNYLNPVLDRVGLWRFLERVLLRVFGLRPRCEAS